MIFRFVLAVKMWLFTKGTVDFIRIFLASMEFIGAVDVEGVVFNRYKYNSDVIGIVMMAKNWGTVILHFSKR